MNESVGSHYLATVRFEFARLKSLAERAMAQVTDDSGLRRCLDPESNSLAVIVHHLAGNMRSRWTDFLTTDGEKPDRNRDGEFDAERAPSRKELLEDWEAGWRCLFQALETLGEADLLAKVRIRGEELTALEAINRQVSHYALHVGQIVFLAKHLVGPGWRSLSIPRGQSAKVWRYKPETGRA